MTPEGNLEYAAARVQAQQSRLPSEGDWQGLESSQDFAHYLDSARRGPLKDWVSGVDTRQKSAAEDVHALERALRRAWVSHVERVASWHPRDWQPWLRWLTGLPSLPLLTQGAALARPAPERPERPEPPAWLLSDPVVGPVARSAAAAHAAGQPAPLPGNLPPALALALTPGLTPASAIHSPSGHSGSEHSGSAGIGAPLAAAWRTRWDALAPQTDADTRNQLNRLSRALDRHGEALPAARSTPALRRELLQRLNVLFRLSAGTAIASACHLGRLALELERLRGGLASRALLGPVAGHATAATR